MSDTETVVETTASDNVIMEIVIGTYERFLLGYNLELESEKFSLKQSFSEHSHLQSVRCIASNNKLLASGSIDERIQLYNMKTRKGLGTLIQHNGTVTSLEFYDSYLISSSEDKTICIWSTKNWQCIKTLSGHKYAVNSISIHPSGKLALSVSRDKTLRTWNLIKGRSAYITNIKKVAELVRWSPDGSHFLVAFRNTIDVYSVESAAVVQTIDFKQKICDLTFIKDEIFAVGGESEDIHFYNMKSGELIHTFNAHKCRVKALECVL
ncbi:p21-activated protein kinase-interacting protein 1-like protein, partial [Stegodyphus mimosarum]